MHMLDKKVVIRGDETRQSKTSRGTDCKVASLAIFGRWVQPMTKPAIRQ